MFSLFKSNTLTFSFQPNLLLANAPYTFILYQMIAAACNYRPSKSRIFRNEEYRINRPARALSGGCLPNGNVVYERVAGI